MADSKIQDLSAGGSADTGDEIPINRNSGDFYLKVANLAPGLSGTASNLNAGRPQSFFQNIYAVGGTSSYAVPGGATSCAVHFQLPFWGSFDRIRMPVSFSNTQTTAGTSAASLNASVNVCSSWNAVVYRYNTAVGVGLFNDLASVASGSGSACFRNSMSVLANGTQYSNSFQITQLAGGTTTTFSTSTARSTSNYSYSSGDFSNFSANRWLDIPFANTLSAGQYWLVFGLSTSSSANSTGISLASQNGQRYHFHYVQSRAAIAFGVVGSTNMTSAAHWGQGSFSTVGGGTTSVIPLSAISSSATFNHPMFQLMRSS